MHVHQMDVISAYTQGELSDEIYMEQPESMYKEAKSQGKLIKPLYALKQSGCEWYKHSINMLQILEVNAQLQTRVCMSLMKVTSHYIDLR